MLILAAALSNSVLLEQGKESRAFLVFGFAKSEQANINDDEEAQFKKMAKELLVLSEEQMAVLIEKGRFSEIEDGEEV